MKAKKDVYILGITGLTHAFHDNSAALFKNHKVIFAVSEERYSRIKHDRNFPKLSIKKALRFARLTKGKINYIAVGYPKRFFLQPFLGEDFVDLFRIAINWIKGRKLKFVKDIANIIVGELGQNSFLLGGSPFKKDKTFFVDHHLAHAASAYYLGGRENCLAVVMDAFGPKTSGKLVSGSVHPCEKGKILEQVEEVGVSSSIGLFYTAVTQALGFTPGDGEGKTMGLAAYGNPQPCYKALIKVAPRFLDSYWEKSNYWSEMFFSMRKEFRPIFDSLPLGIYLKKLIEKHGWKNVAASAQLILEEEVVKYFKYLLGKYGYKDFVLGGGLFLNVKMNKKISEIKGVEEIFVQPNAGDGGTAIGAALYLYSQKYGFKKLPPMVKDVAWGSGYSNNQIRKSLNKFKKKISYRKSENIAKDVAKKLLEGKVMGWFQGRFEWGPRALGYRSVLVDPRRMDIKDKLNNTLKNREWFMPFAPSIMEEYGKDYLLNYKESPFMTMAFDVRRNKVKDIKAAIHIDKTARPNTVSRRDNPLYYKVINEFRKISGIPVILNTSFNKHGLPIVDSPEDAIYHLLWKCIDELAIGDYLVTRNDK